MKRGGKRFMFPPLFICNPLAKRQRPAYKLFIYSFYNLIQTLL